MLIIDGYITVTFSLMVWFIIGEDCVDSIAQCKILKIFPKFVGVKALNCDIQKSDI